MRPGGRKPGSPTSRTSLAEQPADVGADRVRAVHDEVARDRVPIDRARDLERLRAVAQRVAGPTPEPADEQQREHRVAHRPAREDRDPERRGRGQEQREHDRGVAPFERRARSCGRGRARAPRTAIASPASVRTPGWVHRSTSMWRRSTARANTASTTMSSTAQPTACVLPPKALNASATLATGLTTATPGRAGVRGLVAEDGEPREERERADDDRADRVRRGAAPLGRAAHREPEQPEPDDGQERERPVVRVQQQAGDDREQQRAGPTTADRAPARARGTRRSTSRMTSEYMRGFGRVPDRERRRGEQQRQGPRDRPDAGLLQARPALAARRADDRRTKPGSTRRRRRPRRGRGPLRSRFRRSASRSGAARSRAVARRPGAARPRDARAGAARC